jgi:hypothetical protein
MKTALTIGFRPGCLLLRFRFYLILLSQIAVLSTNQEYLTWTKLMATAFPSSLPTVASAISNSVAM